MRGRVTGGWRRGERGHFGRRREGCGNATSFNRIKLDKAGGGAGLLSKPPKKNCE